MSGTSAFVRALDDRVLLGDGGVGVLLGGGPSLPELNLSNPELVRRVHEGFVRAGSDVLATNTLTGGSAEAMRAGARLARSAAGSERFVAGSVGPTAEVGRACRALAEAGCDLLLLETFTKAADLESAFRVALATGLPVVCQMVAPVEGVLERLEAEGAAAVGVNCVGPDEALRALKTVRGRRLTAWPSGGLPKNVDGKVVYPVRPAAFASAAEQILKLGVRLIGGCCGTTPEHLAEVRKVLDRA